jgi:hypothetical protein
MMLAVKQMAVNTMQHWPGCSLMYDGTVLSLLV